MTADDGGMQTRGRASTRTCEVSPSPLPSPPAGPISIDAFPLSLRPGITAYKPARNSGIPVVRKGDKKSLLINPVPSRRGVARVHHFHASLLLIEGLASHDGDIVYRIHIG